MRGHPQVEKDLARLQRSGRGTLVDRILDGLEALGLAIVDDAGPGRAQRVSLAGDEIEIRIGQAMRETLEERVADA